jgi:hypothetical protein
MHPALVVIHWSGFCEEKCPDRVKLRRLIESLAPARVLIYSRMAESALRAAADSLLAPLDSVHPGTLRRVDVFGVTDYGPPQWNDPRTIGALRERVRVLLARH